MQTMSNRKKEKEFRPEFKIATTTIMALEPTLEPFRFIKSIDVRTWLRKRASLLTIKAPGHQHFNDEEYDNSSDIILHGH